jgi:hypothetical protein
MIIKDGLSHVIEPMRFLLYNQVNIGNNLTIRTDGG